jgi:hypothetical protein
MVWIYFLGVIVAVNARENLKSEKLREKLKNLRADNLKLLAEVMQKNAIITRLNSNEK